MAKWTKKPKTEQSKAVFQGNIEGSIHLLLCGIKQLFLLMGWKADLLRIIPPAMFKNKVVVFRCRDDIEKNPSIVDKFKHDRWELSDKEPYKKNMIVFVCRNLNQVILDFNISSLQTTHKYDNSTNLESNGSDNNGKIASSTSTKPTDDFKNEQSNSDDGNNEGSSKRKKVENTK